MKCCFIIDKIRFRIIKYGGELSVHNKSETLGDIIKYAREQSEYTVEELAEKIGISERYMYKIENEGKKPSYDILYKLIRTLSIPSDYIFYPEKQDLELEYQNLFRMLSICDEPSLRLIYIVIKSLLTSQNTSNTQDK